MANYSKVQFISWELNTGPNTVILNSGPYAGKTKSYYPGFSRNSDQRLDAYSQCMDIDARIKFTENAIDLAATIADSDPTVLKVFMAPEFLYRGAGGAYLHDLINGWEGPPPNELGLYETPYNQKWGGLFGGLQQIAVKKAYSNWLFIFGTAISSSFPTYKDSDNKYYLDQKKQAEAYNTALIQLGGIGNTSANYASRKQYISTIDFLNWYTSQTAHTMTNILPADPRALIPADVLGVPEGGAVFNIANVNDNAGKLIDFGIEVCLDHTCSGGNKANPFGRIRTAGQYVKIQLVPSGGLHLIDASIRLQPGAGPTPNSYAFNCDGLNNLNNTVGCHTQIWNGLNGAAVPPANKLFECSNGAILANTQVTKVATSVTLTGGMNVDQMRLWTYGSGHIRVVNPRPL